MGELIATTWPALALAGGLLFAIGVEVVLRVLSDTCDRCGVETDNQSGLCTRCAVEDERHIEWWDGEPA